MAKTTSSLDGFEALREALKNAPEALKLHASQAIRDTANAVADRARKRVPVRTGRLLGAIDAVVPIRAGLSASVGVSDPGAYYWRFVEFGTVRVPARPFFRPAVEAESERFIDRMRAAGQKLEADLGRQTSNKGPSGLGSGSGGLL